MTTKERQWRMNRRKFENIRIGAFVTLTPANEPGTIYTVVDKYQEPIGGVAFEDFPTELFLKLRANLEYLDSRYEVIVGHMDLDADRVYVLANTPLEVEDER